MKRMGTYVVAAVLLLLMVVSVGAQDKPWFDMENCSFCKHLTKDPELMKHMTWTTYVISNGAMVVTVVDEEYQDSYEAAMKAMEKTGKDMMSGAGDVKMCGHCEYYGMLMMSGMKTETINTDVGEITLMTSDKPETIKMIHEYAKRNQEAMAVEDTPPAPIDDLE